jgi:hypothetical protein
MDHSLCFAETRNNSGFEFSFEEVLVAIPAKGPITAPAALTGWMASDLGPDSTSTADGGAGHTCIIHYYNIIYNIEREKGKFKSMLQR